MQENKPKVTLIRWTPNPIETVKLVWDAAKTGLPLAELGVKDLDESHRARELFEKVISMEIPVSEFINFVFVFEHVPIWFREQLIRNNRRGQFWSQSHRIYDMSKLHEEHLYNTAKSIQENPLAKAKYEQHMLNCAECYKDLVALGIPLEDARTSIPVSSTHRISMVINFRDLIYMIHERGCHILQGGMWKPLIDQMIEQLTSKIDPVFAMLKTPVCFNSGKFTYCRFAHDNERRYDGADKLPPCCIWMDKVPPQHPTGLPKYDQALYMKMTQDMVDYYGEGILK